MPCLVPEYFRPFAEYGDNGFDGVGEGGFSAHEVDVGKEVVSRQEVIDVRTHFVGEFPQDAVDFPLFLQFQFSDFVVGFDDFGRFDVRGFPVADSSCTMPLIFRL